MAERVQIAIIGGGIVGCSVLYQLSKLGQTDVLLIEKNDLTSGSTWHAAGNVTFFGHYPSITRMFTESVQIYLEAERESGLGISFHKTGSLRLATNEAELRAYKNLESLYQQINVEYRVVGVPEIKELHPLIKTEDLLGAAYTPGDGHVDPSGATRALAKAATLRGARVRRNSNVESLGRLPSGQWHLTLSEGSVIADKVVVANSFWARELLLGIEIDIPVYAVEHHEVITDRAPEVAALETELPSVRDPIAPGVFRQEGEGLLCGVYESHPVPWAVDGIPEDYHGELFPVDWKRTEAHYERIVERIPAFGSAGVKTVFNGPICYTPDGLPMLGPLEGQTGLWLATGFCIGIGTGGGAARFLSRWIVDGKAPYENRAVDPNRFGNDMTQDEAIKSIIETYAMGYTLPD